jgi:nicotinamide-nucleotide amidase
MQTHLVLLRDFTQRLIDHRKKVVTAESCTGGMLACLLTEYAGSSQWFDRGFITYSNEAKIEIGVSHEQLTQHGAVSMETARAMAQAALSRSQADLSIAITGIAGPSGGSLEKPVGTVCFAWMLRGEEPVVRLVNFPANSRYRIRLVSCCEALRGGIELLT